MNYEQMFWDAYDEDYTTAMRMEEIMDTLGIEFDEDEDGTCRLTYDEYEQVVQAMNGKLPLSNEEMIDELIWKLRKEFDSVRSFEDVGMLTGNKGILITHNGKEYQFELLGSY